MTAMQSRTRFLVLSKQGLIKPLRVPKPKLLDVPAITIERLEMPPAITIEPLEMPPQIEIEIADFSQENETKNKKRSLELQQVTPIRDPETLGLTRISALTPKAEFEVYPANARNIMRAGVLQRTSARF